jgi:tetratricopeptide (TPR) repeat protein
MVGILGAKDGHVQGHAPPPVGNEAWRASAYPSLGQYARAEEVAAQATRRASAQGFRLYLIDALRVLGSALREQGSCEEARRHLTEALALAKEVGCPHARGRALYEVGVLEIRAGDAEGAREQLEQARRILERLGARPDVARVDAAIPN